MNERSKTLVILHFAVFLAGWTGIFGRWISLAGLPLVWYRVIVSVIVMAAVMGIGGKLHRMPWRSVRRIAACGFLLGSVFTIVPFLFQIQALRKLSAFTVNVAYNLEPVYSILFAAIIFDETSEVGLSFWIGVTLVVASVALQSMEAVKARGCA